jgi:ParB family transcriptional regulator, chromosome partitioning protein
MAIKKRGLSKGLDALLADTLDISKISAKTIEESAPPSLQVAAGFVELNVKRLRPGRFQPRRTIQESELEALANSIKEQGVLQPIVVRALGNDGYEIIAGERRWRAAQLAGLQTVPVIIKDVPDEAALAIAIIENIQRENLNPMEEAIALDRLGTEFGLSHEKIASAVGKSRTTVTNLLRLLTLRTDVKVLLERGDIDLGHAKVLLALQGAQQSSVAREVVAKRLSVRETEQLVARTLEGKDKPTTLKHAADPDIRRLEMNLSEKVGAAVKIVQSSKGKGKLLIKYNSLDELDGILAHILQE